MSVDGGVPNGTTKTVDLNIGHNGVAQTAFAIHDALWSAHLYGEMAGGDVPSVTVAYPEEEDTSAFANDDGLHLGEWEWSAWDVIAHEYGHWFDRHHDIASGPGGATVSQTTWPLTCATLSIRNTPAGARTRVGSSPGPRGTATTSP